MALSQPEAKKNLKRSPSNAGSHDPSQTKLRRIQTHHSLRHKSKAPIGQSSSLLDYTQYQDLLNRSIVLALEAVGFHAAKPLALQSFRALVEQYMAHVLASVHKSMLASRRTQSIPQDYLYALRTHQLSLRALQVHLDPPVFPEKSVVSLECDAGSIEDSSFETPDLNGHLEKTMRPPPPYLPKHFPHLPSSHTYKSTSKYTSREADPRKIRERATEEGRLGEAALQKFVGAGSKSDYGDLEGNLIKGAASQRDRGFAAWREAITVGEDEDELSNAIDLLRGTADPGEQSGTLPKKLNVGPIVNADQVFLQKRSPPRQSRPAEDVTVSISAVN